MLMNFKQIKDQFHKLQTDKLVICKKELRYLERIFKFYSANEKDNYANAFTQLNNQIEKLYKKIKELYENEIKKLKNLQEPLDIIVYYDNIEQEIETLLQYIKRLSMKASQNIEEHFDQYIPKALLDRRYNNKALTLMLENNLFRNIYTYYTKSLDSTKEDKLPIFVWDYRNHYKVLDDSDLDPIITNAFWYYEIPRLIPNIAHEVGHLIRSDNPLYNLELFEDKKFTEEILGDFIAYDLFGYGYILSLFHTIAHKEMYKLFYNTTYEDVVLPDVSLWALEVGFAKIKENYARILALVEITLQSDTEDSNKKLYDYLQNIKDFIAHYLSENKNNLIKEFANYPEKAIKFQNFCEEISHLRNKIIRAYQDGFLPWVEDISSGPDRKSEIQTYEEIFNEIWKENIDKSENWVHKNTLRKKLILDIVGIDINEDKLKPFELIYIKKRYDVSNENDTGSKSAIFQDKEIATSEQLFGIYDAFKIIEKKEEIPYDSRDTQQDIDSFLIDIEAIEHSDHYYQKYPLLHLTTRNNAQKPNFPYGLLLHIQLKQANKENIKNFYEKIIKENNRFCSVTERAKYYIYKSLGPHDFILHFPSIKLDHIFALKELCNTSQSISQYIRRTFTTIYLRKKQNQYACKYGTKTTLSYHIEMYLRIKGKGQNIIETLSNSLNNVEYIEKVPGIFDLRIRYNKYVDADIYFNKILNEFKTNSQIIVSDLQSYIFKEKNFKYCLYKKKNRALRSCSRTTSRTRNNRFPTQRRSRKTP
jgi:hypothetical protein